MESLLRARVADALRTAVPRLVLIVQTPWYCWGEIAAAIEEADPSEEEQSALLDALVGVGDRNALLLFAGIFGYPRLLPRAADLPADLQAWLAAEGHFTEGMGAAARAIKDGSAFAQRREREVYRAAMSELLSLSFRGDEPGAGP